MDKLGDPVSIGQLPVTSEALSYSILHLKQKKIPNIEHCLLHQGVEEPYLDTSQALSESHPRK